MSLATMKMAFETPGLNDSQRQVFASLAFHADNGNLRCWPSKRLIGEETSLSRSTTVRALRELERLSLIVRLERWRKNGSQGSNLFTVKLTPPSSFEDSPRKKIISQEDRSTPCKVIPFRSSPSQKTPLGKRAAMRELRPHQTKAIQTLRQALASGSKRPMLCAPTGAGKTLLSAAIVNMALQKRKRVLFTVPAISLIDQTAREFYREGIRDVGVIQADHPMTDASKPVQIASIQTLQRREIPSVDLVLVDEAHRVFDFVADWMGRDDWASIPFIGLSATPWTKGLGRLYDRLIIATTTQELIDQKFLTPFRVFAPSHPDLSKVRTIAGDYHEGDLSRVMVDKALTADIVSTWLAKGENRPTLCFAVDRVHARTIQEQFALAGVCCGYVDANTPRDEREVIRKKFANREYQVVCNVGVLTTGVDWDVRCIILARPTKSEILFVQIVGRGLRTADGKEELLVLDHSDTTLRLGFVTDIQHDRLDGGAMDEAAVAGSQEAAPPKPRECPICSFVMSAKMGSCPSCGHVPSRTSTVEVRAGALVELDPKKKEGWPEKIAFMRQLRAYAIVGHKDDRWIAGKYRAKFGVWPNDPRLKNLLAASSISPEIKSWVQAQNIKWAKTRARYG